MVYNLKQLISLSIYQLNNLFVRAINMNIQNISFSKLLKKKGRSPQLQVPRQRAKLSQIIEQWLQFPTADYTLYLDSMGYSQKTNYPSVGIFTSRNTARPQQQMFDSWILKQSFISNKQNINIMPKKSKVTDSTPKTGYPIKNNIDYEQKQILKNKSKAALNGRFSQIKSIQQSNKSTKYQSQVKINNSKESDTGFKSLCNRNYNLPRENDRNLAIEFQKIDNKQSVNVAKMTKLQDKSVFLDCPETKIEEARSITYQNQISEQQVSCKPIQKEQLENKKNYLHQTQDILNKYNDLSQSQQSVQQLIIQNQTQNRQYKQPLFTEEYAAKIQKEQQMQKLRWKQAKSKLGILLKDISNSSKVISQNLPSFNHNFKKQELEVQPTQDKSTSLSQPQIQVGYSFANNFGKDKEQNGVNQYLTIQNIQQVQSERSPFQQSNDIKNYYERQFKEIAYKYQDLGKSNIIQVEQKNQEYVRQIQNQRTVQKNKDQDEKFYGPHDSFQMKYINVDNEDNTDKMIQNPDDQSESKSYLLQNDYTQKLNGNVKYQQYNFQAHEIRSINKEWKNYLDNHQDQFKNQKIAVADSLLIQNDNGLAIHPTQQIGKQIPQQQHFNNSYNLSVQLHNKQVKSSIQSHVSEEFLISPQKQTIQHSQCYQKRPKFDCSQPKIQYHQQSNQKPEQSIKEQGIIQIENKGAVFQSQHAQFGLQAVQKINHQAISQILTEKNTYIVETFSRQIQNIILLPQLCQKTIETLLPVSRQQDKSSFDKTDRNIMNSPLYDIIVQRQQEHIVSILKLEEEQARSKKNKSVTFIEPVAILTKPQEIKEESDSQDFAFDL